MAQSPSTVPAKTKQDRQLKPRKGDNTGMDWEPPKDEQEFVFEGIDKAPAWVDKNWAGFSQGPALAIPQGNINGWTGPYHTKFARIGDTVKFIPAKGSREARLVIIEGTRENKDGTKRLPAISNASLEDQLKLGWLTVDDLGEDAKGQVLARTPGMKRLIEEGVGEPDEQNIGDLVKT